MGSVKRRIRVTIPKWNSEHAGVQKSKSSAAAAESSNSRRRFRRCRRVLCCVVRPIAAQAACCTAATRCSQAAIWFQLAKIRLAGRKGPSVSLPPPIRRRATGHRRRVVSRDPPRVSIRRSRGRQSASFSCPKVEGARSERASRLLRREVECRATRYPFSGADGLADRCASIRSFDHARFVMDDKTWCSQTVLHTSSPFSSNQCVAPGIKSNAMGRVASGL